MIIIFSLFIGLAVTIAAWFLFKYIVRISSAYQSNLSSETKQTFDDVFLFLDIGQLRPVILFMACVSMLFTAWLIGRWWGVLPALVALVFAPHLLLAYLRKKRNHDFDRLLPDFLLSLAGSVKAGSSLQQSLQSIIVHAKGPVAEEFGLLLREQRMGLSFSQVLATLQTRIPTESCALVVSALHISAQTGGSLASTLENIAHTLNARNHWLSRVKALTAQGRMQSLIMALLPFLLLFVLYYLEPHAMSQLWQTWYGWVVMLAIIFLETLGIFWIYKIANIKI